MDLGGHLRRPASCLLAVFALGACGPGVTLTLRDGSMWSGRPIANDDTTVEIQSRDGRYVFCKSDVTDADHAGNGALYAGLLITAAGSAVLVGSTRPSRYANQDVFWPTVGLVMLAAGLATGITGLAQFLVSKSRTGLPPSAAALRKPCKPPARYIGP